MAKKLSREKVQKYLEVVLRRMGLRHWTIVLKKKPCDGGLYASIDLGTLEAKVRICEGFEKYPPAKQRLILVHECCHIPLSQVTSVMTVMKNKKRGAWQFAANHLDEAIEEGTELFARIIAKEMPLPDLLE
jgi:hypothetical protein